MTPAEYTDWLEIKLTAEIRVSIDEVATKEKRRMLGQIPASRRLTRRAFRHRVKHIASRSEIRIGLQFNKRYPIRGTETQRLMLRLWKQNQQHIQPTLNSIINKRIRSI